MERYGGKRSGISDFRFQSAISEADGDVFGFEEGIQTFGAEFAAPAGVFQAAEGGVGGGGDAVVDADGAGFEVFHDADGAGEVAGEGVGGEAVGGSVGAVEAFGFGIELHDGGDG